MKLQDQLNAFKAEFEGGKPPYNVPPEAIDAMHRATAELIASGAPGRALKVGDAAPAFALQDPNGDVFSSDALLARGPLVISFYRGVWCPYCNMELQALQQSLSALRALGASLVAISPQTTPNSRRSMRENKLDFPILSDAHNGVAESFGLRFQLPDYLAAVYQQFKIDLESFNGDPSWTLPMPARFVIGVDGKIAYAEVNPDYTVRPEPEDILVVLRAPTKSKAA